MENIKCKTIEKESYPEIMEKAINDFILEGRFKVISLIQFPKENSEGEIITKFNLVLSLDDDDNFKDHVSLLEIDNDQ